MSRAKAPRWRRATAKDSALLLRWRNDALTRRNSLSTARVTRSEHESWLARRLTDSRCGLWLALDGSGRPVGQLRVDLSAHRGTVSVTVSPARRGEGWATAMLRTIPAKAKVLRAVIRPDNAHSAVAFLKAGFRFRRVIREGGAEVYELERRGGFRA